MTDKTRYSFRYEDAAYAPDDPNRWQPAGAPRLCDSDAQAEHHARWMAYGQVIRISRPGATWSVFSPHPDRR